MDEVHDRLPLRRAMGISLANVADRVPGAAAGRRPDESISAVVVEQERWEYPCNGRLGFFVCEGIDRAGTGKGSDGVGMKREEFGK
ncbi:UNVERIFIED_CONTAM: hypothetical protein Sangu_3015700 [Sesamum angustifolium]|uniref:Uncharacterized protein n=1 Tax=Sesamum angustifolium TaxID=2727405 RepID=A0AAW2KMF6_9LAMI